MLGCIAQAKKHKAAAPISLATVAHSKPVGRSPAARSTQRVTPDTTATKVRLQPGKCI